MPNANGIAVVMKFENVVDLKQHSSQLSMSLHGNLFEIVGVQISKCCVQTPCEKQMRKV